MVRPLLRPPHPAPSRDGGGAPWTFRGARGVGVLLAAWMVAAVLLALARPGAVWSVRLASLPPPAALAWTALYVVLALTFRAGRAGWDRALRNALLTATLLGYHLTYEVALLGDYDQWTLLSTQRVASIGEPLANALYFLVQHAFGPTALPLVPPVVGAITTWTYLAVSERLLRAPPGSSANAARVAAIAWLAWGGQAAFFSNAIENTQLSLPLVLVWVLALVRMAEAGGQGPAPVAALARCGVLLGAGALLHGQVWFLAPALLLAILLDARAGRVARRVPRAAGTLGLALAVYGAGLAVLGALGFRIVVGNALGGGDGWPFVPLTRAAGPFDRYVLLSAAHGRELGSVLLLSGAVVPLWLASLLARARSERFSVLALVALAEAAFLSVYQFDLGFPGDLDLMTSLTVVLLLWSLGRALSSGLRAPALLAACALGLVLSGGVLGSLLQPRPSEAPVSLIVEGVRARPGTPLALEPRSRDGALTFEIHGPPRAFCTLVSGPPVPGGYKASVAAEPLHVALTDETVRTLFTGRLDGEGRATGTLSAGELGVTDEGVLLQALVLREAPGAHACQATAALRVLGGGGESR